MIHGDMLLIEARDMMTARDEGEACDLPLYIGLADPPFTALDKIAAHLRKQIGHNLNIALAVAGLERVVSHLVSASITYSQPED
jgi:hypothetical protein